MSEIFGEAINHLRKVIEGKAPKRVKRMEPPQYTRRPSAWLNFLVEEGTRQELRDALIETYNQLDKMKWEDELRNGAGGP